MKQTIRLDGRPLEIAKALMEIGTHLRQQKAKLDLEYQKRWTDYCDGQKASTAQLNGELARLLEIDLAVYELDARYLETFGLAFLNRKEQEDG